MDAKSRSPRPVSRANHHGGMTSHELRHHDRGPGSRRFRPRSLHNPGESTPDRSADWARLDGRPSISGTVTTVGLVLYYVERAICDGPVTLHEQLVEGVLQFRAGVAGGSLVDIGPTIRRTIGPTIGRTIDATIDATILPDEGSPAVGMACQDGYRRQLLADLTRSRSTTRKVRPPAGSASSRRSTRTPVARDCRRAGRSPSAPTSPGPDDLPPKVPSL